MAIAAGLRLPSLNGLRAFEASARHLNFRLAADELGVTHSAVAQLVRGLEEDLAVKLFERLPRMLALTGAGRIYAGQVCSAFELLRDATTVLRPQPRQITISVTPTFASKWLIPRLPEFVAANPLLDLRVLATESRAGFQTDGVDIAVRQGSPPFGPGLAAELLFEQDVAAVCSPALLDAEQAVPSLQRLANIALLHDTHDLWPAFLERFDPSAAVKGLGKGIRFNQTALAIDAAIAGQGLALASRFLVERDLAAGRLALACEFSLKAAQDFYIVWPRKPRHPEQTFAARDWLKMQALL